MTLPKLILVPVTGTASDPVGLAVAASLARRFAPPPELNALFLRPDPRDAIPLAAEGLSPTLIETFVASAEDDLARRAQGVLASLANAQAIADGLTLTHGEVPATADAVARASQASDLVVFGPAARDTGRRSYMAFEAALMQSGRPVVVAAPTEPGGPSRPIGATIAIAWNGTVESSHALHGALPLLAVADRVALLTAETGRTKLAEGERLLPWLRRHAPTAQLVPVRSVVRGVGAALLAAAQAEGADLLVMGGFGTSRFRELILGGVTRHVLANAPMPVLLAH